MDRSQLRNIIESGRAIALDCHAIGKSIPADDPIGKLFQTDLLNKSILIKRFQPALATARQNVIVGTVVYFPYDFENPYDGGESIEFSGFGFPEMLMNKLSHGEASPEVLERVKKDVKTLSLIETMHSLDPFMFKSKAEQHEMDDEIHPAYFAITKSEWDKIRLPIRDKIARLVEKALDGQEVGQTDSARKRYIGRFLMKIWQARDIEGIEPFVKALQIAPEQAPEIFFAWKAVFYYQVRFKEIEEDLKALFLWIGNNQLCFPVNSLEMPEEQQNQILERRGRLRVKMREAHVEANQIITKYENSYDQFVNADNPQLFIEFLGNSANSYLSLAAHVSTATHCINLWKYYMTQFGAELRQQQFNELFDGLAMLNAVARMGGAGSEDFFID